MQRFKEIVCVVCVIFASESAFGTTSPSRRDLTAATDPSVSMADNVAGVPAAPIPLGPPRDEILGANDTALVWQSDSGAYSYRVQIAIDSAYFTIVLEDTTIVGDTTLPLQQFVGTKLRVGTKYFWRVSASNASGAGPYSTVWSFVAAQVREFVPGASWLDTNGNMIEAHGGGILYDDSSGTYYWYGEDRSPSSSYAIGVSCYSSKNLYSWKFQGVVLPASATDDSGATPVLERPKVVYNDSTKKYVMWMHIDSPNYAYAEAGVAVSDSPTGPFQYLGSLRPENSMSRDMTLFKDDNGKAYLVSSSENNQTMHVTLLTPDYLHPSGTYARVLISDSREAPAMFKYGNEYYLITSGTSGWAPNEARYATATSPLGPWTMQGNPCSGPNADITFGGQSTFVLPIKGEPGDFIFMADKWVPSNLPTSTYIWLPLQVKDGKVTIPWYNTWSLSIFSTTLGVKSNTHAVPETYSLSQNYPNPFNPTTVIKFGVRSSGFVSLRVYDVLGRLVKTLVDRVESPGSYEVEFNAADLSSGVYFYRLEVKGSARTMKMMVLK